MKTDHILISFLLVTVLEALRPITVTSMLTDVTELTEQQQRKILELLTVNNSTSGDASSEQAGVKVTFEKNRHLFNSQDWGGGERGEKGGRGKNTHNVSYIRQKWQ